MRPEVLQLHHVDVNPAQDSCFAHAMALRTPKISKHYGLSRPHGVKTLTSVYWKRIASLQYNFMTESNTELLASRLLLSVLFSSHFYFSFFLFPQL